MQIIKTTEDLRTFCDAANLAPYVTVDTEFLRERTYYSKLCLVQLALPKEVGGQAVIVDPLIEDLDLSPLSDLFRNTDVVKVFHAARQDLEIFWIDEKVFPEPLFDTQVAAMVCGYGDQVGYETLVRKIPNATVDKTSRFTDWSRRPLSDAQLEYAISDVTYLRDIYEHLSAELDRTDRRAWVEEELAILTDPTTYEIEPDQAWKRVKTRTNSGKFLAYVKELAAFRERHAQTRNIPRNRVFKDDALVELASTKPKTLKDLSKSRLLLREARKGDIADGIIDAIGAASKYTPEMFPKPSTGREKLNVNPALADLLRVLLKAKSDQSNVAQKMISSVSDLDAIAAGVRDVPALQGWRKQVFGDDALKLCEGQVAIGLRGNKVRLIEL